MALKDLAEQMTSLQRLVSSPSPPAQRPAGFRRKIETAMELANEQLLWQVQLVDEASPCK